MPKIKPTQKEEVRRIVRAQISANQNLYGLDISTMATKAGISTRTFYSRLEAPENLTLNELQNLSKLLKWTPVQAASIILGRLLTAKEVKDFILM